MKICFMLGGFTQNGGIGRVTSILINRIASDCPDIEIVTLSYFKTGKPNLYSIHEKIEQTIFLDKYCNMSKLMLTGGVKKLKKFLFDNEIDVIIACGALFYPICVNAVKNTDKKCICWEHTDPQRNSDHKGQNLCRRYGVSRSDINVVLTKSALDVYKNIFNAHNTIQIYNPIEDTVFKYFKGYDKSSKRIISVGRLTYQKNFENAIEVARRVLPNYPEWTWDIYGDGELREKLQTTIRKYGLENRVNLKGQVADIYRRYHDYSFMVMTSRYEGFPMSLLEGMGNGLPLISYDISTGPNEIINDSKNGFLVKNSDSESMVKSISRLIDDSDLREKMSNYCIKMSDNFKEGKIVEQWISILKQL